MYNLITQHRKEKVKGGDANAADRTSHINYGCFGDVLQFDSTYNRNVYNKPLVIFSGSNHNGQTVIFGCGLLVNEDIGSYKWLLETFLEAMGNKHPMAVVTDGDLSMREDIKQVKNSGFLNDFKKLIYANVSVEEFHVMWRIGTTSQCEGINSLIKAYVRNKDTLLEFINNMETDVSHYRNNERVVEFNSKYTNPVLVTSLPTLEDFSTKAFTRNMFREVRKEIEGACAMNTELSWGMLHCECLWFENRGIPCMHIFACLKLQHVEVIPECLVCKRWTKNAKSDLMKSNVDDPSDSDKVLKCRLGVLGAECSRLMDVAWHYNKSCLNVPDRILKEPVDDDTEKNISSHLDILTKCKRHDSVKNQQKMEKDRNIGGGTTQTSTAKSAFTDQVKTSSPGPDIPVCASTSNEESGISSRLAESPVLAPETGMAD
ncbi:hypothetical protein AHAS_Ahas11G0138800 [Arachis hypogaea]